MSAVALLLTLPPALAGALTVERGDGSVVHYTLDRPNNDAEGLLLIVQGSGCAPGATNPNMAMVRAAFANYATVIVEKIGVSPDLVIADEPTDCPAEFVTNYTFSQRLSDYRRVLEALAEDDTLPERLVMFGGSEGGLAVAALAGEFKADAAILLSSATGPSFGEMVKATVPQEAHPHFDAAFAAARANPDSREVFGGYPLKFWADIIDVSTAERMARGDGPYLIIQGGQDEANPLALARQTVDAYSSAGGCGLTYWEFPLLDHSMAPPDGTSRLAEVMTSAAEWAEAPMADC
ncbi:alpha/beta hydrolase family protein [Devosia lucknowensis]|uniref:alpha/beta hydrolase family protein n=1 Tax=Devosia lucknowensis TaxID=1096929 RepID=UPI0011226E7F|nr:hypothetical protein [Devosia lucknowensis]